jgi:recombinational DNA repair protein RecR
MSNPEYLVHFTISSMQRVTEQLDTIASDLPIGVGLDALDIEQLHRALEV